MEIGLELFVVVDFSGRILGVFTDEDKAWEESNKYADAIVRPGFFQG